MAAWQSVPLLGHYRAICRNCSFYEIIKSKDFDRCTDNPFRHSANPPYYNCASLAGSNCRKAIQRMSTTRYFACGHWPQIQFLRIDNWGHLLAQPFGIDNKQITDAVVTNLQLKGRQTISSTLTLPQQMEEFTSLSYTFPADVSQSRCTRRWFNPFIHCSFE